MKTLLMLIALCALAGGLRAEDIKTEDGFIGGITVKLAGYMQPTTPFNTQFSSTSIQGTTQTATTTGGLDTNVGGTGFSLDILLPMTDQFTFGLGGDYFQSTSSLKGTTLQTSTSAPSSPVDSALYSSWSNTGFKVRVSAVWYFRPFRH